MRNKRKLIVVIGIVAAAIAVAASLNTYSINEGGGGRVLWNNNEAYVFVEDIRRGYHFTYLRYPLELLGEYFYWVPDPDVQQVHLVVFKLTSDGIDRHVIDERANTANPPDSYTPMGEEIYAWCPGVVCKWTGTDFKPVDNTEAKRIGGAEGLASRDFTGVSGWSKYTLGSAPAGSRSTIKVDELIEISVDHHAQDRFGHSAISVEVMRPGHAPERIWYIDDRPRTVSRAEYERVFGQR
ncbi:MAG: hypothetical protein WBQ00_04175 [Terriglobales bacterium]